MNERIRELAKQALPNVKYWDEEFIPGTLGISIPDTRATNLKELEKFAELIVQECAKIADNPSQGAFTSIGNDIRKHFGVES